MRSGICPIIDFNLDAWTYRIVGVLGLIVVTCVINTIVLELMGWSIPELLVALGPIAIGGLARLSVPSPLNRGLLE